MQVLMLVPHPVCELEMLEVFLKKLSCLQCHHQTILVQKVTAGSSWLGSWPSLPSCQRQFCLRDMFFCCWDLLSWLFSDDVQDLLNSHVPVLWIVRLAKKFSPRQEKAFLQRTGATIILDSVEIVSTFLTSCIMWNRICGALMKLFSVRLETRLSHTQLECTSPEVSVWQ